MENNYKNSIRKVICIVTLCFGFITNAQDATYLDFDGVNDVVVCGTELTNHFTGKSTITVEAMVYPTSNTGNGVVVGNYDFPNNSSSFQFLIRRDGNDWRFFINNGTGTDITATNAVVLNTWQHVAGVWDGTTASIYIDGVLKAEKAVSASLGFPNVPSDVVLGWNANNEGYKGEMDEVRIWDIARTSTEIMDNKDSELVGNETGLQAYYQFNQGINNADNTAITTLLDETGNHYNGTLTNFGLTGTVSNWSSVTVSKYIVNTLGGNNNSFAPIDNSSGSSWAQSFLLGGSDKNLNSIELYMSGSVGSIANISIRNDNGGLPGSVFENVGNFTFTTSGLQYISISSAVNSVLSANTVYWVYVSHDSGPSMLIVGGTSKVNTGIYGTIPTNMYAGISNSISASSKMALGVTTLSNCTTPSSQASSPVFGTETDSTLVINSFTAPPGGVTGYVVYINNTNNFTAPTNGTAPTADTSWNNDGQQAVYFGVSASPNTTITGLDDNTTYYFQIYAYDNCGGTETYETTGLNTNDTTAVDVTAPTVTSVTVPENATYTSGNNLDFTINFSEAVTVIGTPQLNITIGATTRQAIYQSGSETDALLFRYTIQASDLDADGITIGTLDANGGTLTDTANNDAVLTLNNVGATAGVLVDSINNKPVFTGLDNNPTYTENGDYVVLDADVTISDVELDAANNYNGASFSISRNGGSSTEDEFYLTAELLTRVFTDSETGNLIVYKNSKTIAIISIASIQLGSPSITFTDANGEIPTASDVNAILQAIIYKNNNNNPPASVTLHYTFNDGTENSEDINQIVVSINAVNDAPTFTSTPITTVNEGETYMYTLTTKDLDSDAVTITATEKPDWLTLEGIEVSTLAGSSDAGFLNGTGTAAKFHNPTGVAIDRFGNMYVADLYSNAIRKVSSAGEVTTLAGVGNSGYWDGVGYEVRFNNPYDIAIDVSGNVYVADTENNRIRKITANGEVSTFAGSGAAGLSEGMGISAQFNKPRGIAIDTSGNLYVADYKNNRIRKITPEGEVSTFAGSTNGYKDGLAGSAQFYYPSGVAVDVSGNLYVADTFNHRIRKITTEGEVSTFAGSGDAGLSEGNGTSAQFNQPLGVAVDISGNVYVADSANHRIRKINTSGDVTTLAGSGDAGYWDIEFVDGLGAIAKFSVPTGIAIDATGNLYVADSRNNRIRKITQQRLIGTPSTTDVGDHNVVLEVTDGKGGVTTQTFTITVADITPPTIVSFSPADDATEVEPNSDLILTFNENITKGTGDIIIYDAADDSIVETIDVASANVSITDTAVTINPSTDLLYGKNYYVQIVATTFKDDADNAFAGIADKTTFSFTTEANTAPTFTSTPIITATENAEYIYEIVATDSESDALAITATEKPNWLSLETIYKATTLAGSGETGFIDGSSTSAQFNYPLGMAIDATGNMYIADNENHRIRKVTSSGEVVTLAGSTEGFLDGTGNSAQFSYPSGVAVDASGNVYVADSGNNSIRKITPSGEVTTLAGSTDGFLDGIGTSAQFSYPKGVVVDASGNVYVADAGNKRIRKITPSGAVTTLAGSTYGFVDGTGTSAQFGNPSAIVIGSSGNLYVVDSWNHSIRKVSVDGEVTTLAGTGFPGNANGTGSLAQFNYPSGIAVDPSGNIYVADSENNRVRKITAEGEVSTLAGSTPGFVEGIGTLSKFGTPSGLVIDKLNNLFFTDSRYNKIVKITPKTRLIGTPTNTDLGTHNVALEVADGKGSTTPQDFTITVVEDINVPTIITLNPLNNAIEVTPKNDIKITFSENIVKGTGNIIIYEVTGDQIVETIEVTATNVTITDATVTINPSTHLLYNKSYYIQIATTVFKDISGNNFVGIEDKTTYTFATESNTAPTFTSTPITSVNENMNYAYEINGTDNDNDAFAITAPNKPDWLDIDTKVEVSTLVGSESDGGPGFRGLSESLNNPSGLAVDASGNIYVADTDNRSIKKISSSGEVTIFAGSGDSGYEEGLGTQAKFRSPRGVAVDASGNVYVADTGNHGIRKISPLGEVTTFAGGQLGFKDDIGSFARFNSPFAIALDASGNVYVADTYNNCIRKINPSGEVTTLAGSNNSYGDTDGTGTSARFHRPNGIAVDTFGNVYVTDTENHKIKKITPSGEVTTFAGSTEGLADGTGTSAQFLNPKGIAIDAFNNLYVADYGNNRIRKITPLAEVTTFAGSGDTGYVGEAKPSFSKEQTALASKANDEGDGLALSAEFDRPFGVAVDALGNVFVCDYDSNKIRKISSTTSLIGTPTHEDVGSYPTELYIKDWKGEKTTQSFTITVTSINSFTATTGNWSDINNWSLARVPLATDDVLIPDNKTVYVDISTAEANNVEVDGVLSVNSGDGITIHGDLTQNGTFTINSDGSTNGSLILKGNHSNVGSVDYVRYVSASDEMSKGWHLISSPVRYKNISDFYPNLATVGDKLGIEHYVNTNVAGTKWEKYAVTDTPGYFVGGKGYAVKKENSGTLTFNGIVNTYDVDITVYATGDQFNAIGNPFTSYLNSTAFLENTTTDRLTENTIWLWDEAGNGGAGEYITKNNASEYKIAPGQGFFVKAKETGDVTFSKSLQMHEGGNTFLKQSATPKITISISDGNNLKSTEIFYIKNKTTGFDNGYDSSVFNGVANSFNIYSQLVTDNEGKNLAIQTLPNTDYENMVVPLGLYAVANKEITFSAEVLNLPSDIKVILEDRLTHTFIPLQEINSSYKVTLTEAINGIGRFYLYTSEKSLSVNDDLEQEKISIYKTSNTSLRVTGLQQGKTTIRVVTILGKSILQESFIVNNSIKDFTLPKIASGVYIVQLKTDKGNLDKKIIIE